MNIPMIEEHSLYWQQTVNHWTFEINSANTRTFMEMGTTRVSKNNFFPDLKTLKIYVQRMDILSILINTDVMDEINSPGISVDHKTNLTNTISQPRKSIYLPSTIDTNVAKVIIIKLSHHTFQYTLTISDYVDMFLPIEYSVTMLMTTHDLHMIILCRNFMILKAITLLLSVTMLKNVLDTWIHITCMAFKLALSVTMLKSILDSCIYSNYMIFSYHVFMILWVITLVYFTIMFMNIHDAFMIYVNSWFTMIMYHGRWFKTMSKICIITICRICFILWSMTRYLITLLKNIPNARLMIECRILLHRNFSALMTLLYSTIIIWNISNTFMICLNRAFCFMPNWYFMKKYVLIRVNTGRIIVNHWYPTMLNMKKNSYTCLMILRFNLIDVFWYTIKYWINFLSLAKAFLSIYSKMLLYMCPNCILMYFYISNHHNQIPTSYMSYGICKSLIPILTVVIFYYVYTPISIITTMGYNISKLTQALFMMLGLYLYCSMVYIFIHFKDLTALYLSYTLCMISITTMTGKNSMSFVLRQFVIFKTLITNYSFLYYEKSCFYTSCYLYGLISSRLTLYFFSSSRLQTYNIYDINE